MKLLLLTIATLVSISANAALVTRTTFNVATNALAAQIATKQDTIWNNSGGVISPASGQDTNVLRFTSGLADNSTNKALVIDTVNPWGNGKPISVSTAGDERLFLKVNENWNLFTIQSLDNPTTPTNKSIVDLNAASISGASQTKAYASLSSTSDDFDSVEASALMESVASSGSATLSLSGTLDGWNTNPSLTMLASAAGGAASSVRILGQDIGTGATFFDLAPGVSASTTPYKFNTKLAHTSGNILEAKNNNTNKVIVAFDGATTIAQSLDEPAAPAAGYFTLFATNNAGKMVLKVKFPTGASQVIATEP